MYNLAKLEAVAPEPNKKMKTFQLTTNVNILIEL